MGDVTLSAAQRNHVADKAVVIPGPAPESSLGLVKK